MKPDDSYEDKIVKPKVGKVCNSTIIYHIGGVMVRVLASSVVDHWFEPRSGQPKDY